MHDNTTLEETQKKWHGTLSSYAIGFILSLLLTVASFSLVVFGLLSKEALVYAVVALGSVQAIIQLLFFLHLEVKSSSWEMMIFYFMLLVLGIIVGGSLWIMHDLNSRVMEMPTLHD